METIHSSPSTLFSTVLLLTCRNVLGQTTPEYISKELFLIVVRPLYGLFVLLVLVLLIVCFCSCYRHRADNSRGQGIHELAKQRETALVIVEEEKNFGNKKEKTGYPAERVTSHIYDIAEDDQQQATKHASKNATVAAPASKTGATTRPAKSLPAHHHPATRQTPPISDGGTSSLASGSDAGDVTAVQIRPYMPMMFSLDSASPETPAGQQQPYRHSRNRPPTYEVYLHPVLPPPRGGHPQAAAPLPLAPTCPTPSLRAPAPPPLPLHSHPSSPSPTTPSPAPAVPLSPACTFPAEPSPPSAGPPASAEAGRGARASEARAEMEEEETQEEEDGPATVYDTPRAGPGSLGGVAMATTFNLGDLGLLEYCSVGEAAAALHSHLLAAGQKTDKDQPVSKGTTEATELPKEVEKTQL